MSTPLNLNRFRKERARAEKKARAEENSVQYGQTKAEKQLQKARAEQITRTLDGHKRET